MLCERNLHAGCVVKIFMLCERNLHAGCVVKTFMLGV